MKILDEKGRIFGKINIVDFLIITLILIIIPTFFCIYKILGTTPMRIPFQWVKVEALTFTIPEIAELFQPGDVAKDTFGNPDGRLLRVLKRDPAYIDRFKKAIIGEHNPRGYEHRIPVLLEVELLCTKSSKFERWYYRRNQIVVSVDNAFIFSGEKYTIHCYALKIEDK